MNKPVLLLVDDTPFNLTVLNAILKNAYTTLMAKSGPEALQLAHASPMPDLILLDVTMPGMDGYAVCQRLKEDPATTNIPVIFVTALTEGAEEAHGFAMGAVDYIHRPFDPTVVLARIRNQLAITEARNALRQQNAQLEAMVAERTAAVERTCTILRTAMRNLQTTQVTTGVYWIQVPEAGLYILCGSPADVVKHLMLRGYIVQEQKQGVACETGPNVILLSDTLVQNGRFANLAEFPVLQMLYRQGLILPGHPNNTGFKPLLIGSEAQVRAQMAYIYRGNYGLVNEEELQAAGLDAEEARRMMAIKLGFAFGRIRPTEELLDHRFVDQEPVELHNGVFVRRLGLNRFEFRYQERTTEVDLNLQPGEDYEAPYALEFHQVERQFFAVLHCGEGDGWDLRRQSMASIIVYQGRFFLVDAGPSVLHTLRSLGIDVSEVEGIFHTHAHDDHFSSLPTLIASGHRIKYFATPLVRHSVTKKLAALMSIDESLFGEFFEINDLEEGIWNDCDGLQVMPLYSPHPVETNLFLFRTHDDEGFKTYAHWADIVSMEVLERLVATAPDSAAIPPDFVETVRKRYLTHASLKKLDAGGGLIHGSATDFRHDPSEKIILAHRSTPFTREQLEVGSQTSFGAMDVLIPTTQDYLRQRAFRFLDQLFPNVGISKLNALLRSPVVSFNAGSLILRRGGITRHVYLLLTGSVEHSQVNSQVPLTVPTGSFIGAQALFEDAPLSDCWRASSHVRLLRMGVGLMKSFLHENQWYEQLRAILAAADFFQSTWLFGERVTFSVLSQLAQTLTSVCLAAGEATPTGNTPCLYLVKSGELELRDRTGRILERVTMGGFVGEEGYLSRAPAPWQAIAKERTELAALAALDLRAMPILLWKLLETHDRRLRLKELTE